MGEILEWAYGFVWGVPALLGILGVGLYLSLHTGFFQIRSFPAACRAFWYRLTGKGASGEGVSSFQALCTALSATVGTGNLVGVAGALAIGGPGAIFWMWVSAVLGMVTKLAEAALSVRYRDGEPGHRLAGPMYIIRNGMSPRWGWLAGLYSFFGVIAAFGVGNATQVDALIGGLGDCVRFWGGELRASGELLIGASLAVVVLILLLGGTGRIGAVAERLVPFAAAGYLLLGCLVLVLRAEAVPRALGQVIRGAFDPGTVTGGAVGSFWGTMRIGVSRGVFTNEAGMGTAGIAHGAAEVDHPVEQGLMGIMEVFLDTIVICTMTALVILCSGVPIGYGTDVGVMLSGDAFSLVLGDWVRPVIAFSLCLFAFATILGWGVYGARCAQYLFGKDVWGRFAWIQAGVILIGATLSTGTVWRLAEIVNGLMAIPNLIALAACSPELCRLIIEYRKRSGDCAGGGKSCKYLSMPIVVNRPPCVNSTPSRWRQRSRGRRSIT